MPTKKELQEKIKLKNALMDKMILEVELIKKDYDKHIGFIQTITKVLQEINHCYPHILTECCTNKELIAALKMQEKFSQFINKLLPKDKESGDNEI